MSDKRSQIRHSIITKITGGFAILIIAIAVIGIYSYTRLNAIAIFAQQLMDRDNSRCLIKDIIIKSTNIDNYIEKYMAATDPEQKENLGYVIVDELRIIKEFMNQIHSRELVPEEHALHKKLDDVFLAYESSAQELFTGRFDRKNFYFLSNKFITQLIHFDTRETELMYDSWEYASGRLGMIKFFIILSITIALAIGASLIIMSYRTIALPMKRVASVLDRYGAGDFSVRAPVTGKDEIGNFARRFNDMLDQIRDYAQHIEQTNRFLQQKNEEILHTRLYLQNMIDSMPSMMMGIDNEGVITHWNLMAERTTGISREKAEGMQIESLYPEIQGHMEKIRRAIAERVPQISEKVPHDRDGEVTYSDYTIYPLVTNGVEGAVIRIDDVTSRVRIEDMMIQTEKMLSVGGLAAGMAHEINNPLGGILMGVNNIQRRISPDLKKNNEVAVECGIDMEKLHEYIEKREISRMISGIKELAVRATGIVVDMLSFSRASSSRLEPVSLADVIEKTVSLAAHDYDLKNNYDFRKIQILREFDSELPPVPCVAVEIEQVMLNLLKNAAHALAAKEPGDEKLRIVLRLRREWSMARIEVEDNGPGMDQATAKRIFEPFFTTKPVGQGTGLGLSVSYFIITRNHHGIMNVESVKGKGTKFIISIPLARQE
jgi:PAS domain S-box-containing protein